MATEFSFDLERCTECQRCMMSCSVAKEGRVLPARSRISHIRLKLSKYAR